MKADLHMHSLYSDGKLSLKEIVDRAKLANLDYIALTDHDSIMGVEEITKIGDEEGIKVIPGLELSTNRNNEAIHILGYFKSYASISQSFKDYLLNMKKTRYERLKKMTDLLNERYHLGIDFQEIALSQPFNLERPHLADQIMKKTGLSRAQVFKEYIGNDCPCYVPSTKITVEEGIRLIHEAGGLAILAHPYIYEKNNPMDLLKMGVDGIEVFYFPVKDNAYPKYLKYAKDHHLLVTGGSDFHRDDDEEKHADIGLKDYDSFYIDEFLQKLDEIK